MTQETPFVDGYRLIDGTTLNTVVANPVWSVAAKVTAIPGGSVQNSTKIGDTITQVVTSVLNAGVVLPNALPGMIKIISNATANNIVVFAEGGSTVNGIPGNVGDVLSANAVLFYVAVEANVWQTFSFIENLGTAAFKDIGSLAGQIPYIDPTGAVLVAKQPGTGGWVFVGTVIGLSNDSGLEINATNDFAFVLRDRTGVIKTWLKSDGTTQVIDGLPAYFPRAWAKFNGTGSPVLLNAGNISSIADNGVGDYTINFTIALPDANYSAVANYTFSDTASAVGNNGQASCWNYTANSVRVYVADGSGTPRDPLICSITILR